MFHLLSKNLFFLPSRSSFSSSSSSSSQVRRLLSRFPVRDFSSSSYPTQRGWKYYINEEEYEYRVSEENIPVSVWWNFNDCSVPPGVSVSKVAFSIMGAVRANGIEGPIDIAAYGDVTHFSKLERRALSSIGVDLYHYTGGKDMINKHLKNDLLCWTITNPPPVHIFLISSDENLLHYLRRRNYNMLVAFPERASYVMCSATTIIWPWSSILKGENLIGKYFNYPPDGPLDSCYGDLKGPIENPDSALEESNEEVAKSCIA